MSLSSFWAGVLLASVVWLIVWRRAALDLAHEVRRPMTALLLAAEGLRAHLRDHEMDALTKQVQKASDLLTRADLASRVLGRLGRPQSVRDLDASEPVEEVLRAWAPAARALGREIQIPQGVLHGRVNAPDQIAQCLASLVANALEHGAGDVVLSSRATAEGGIGIEVANATGDGSQWFADHRYRGRGLRIAGAVARRGGARLVPWSAESGSARLEVSTKV